MNEKGKLGIMALFGSPRRGGNTDILLEEVLRGVGQKEVKIQKIYPAELNISPCQGCRKCEERGKCVISDQMQGIYSRLLTTDAIILASPIFFYGLTAQTKAFIDRCQALWARKYVLKIKSGRKTRAKGWFVAVGATRGARLFQGVALTVKYFFDAFDAEYTGELFFSGIEKKEEILSRPAALQQAFELGKQITKSVGR